LIKKEDIKILELVHELEQIENLDENEKFLLQFLRTQLEDDWRTPCLDILNAFKKHADLEPGERWKQMKHVYNKWWMPNK